jgi:hypothetical protein
VTRRAARIDRDTSGARAEPGASHQERIMPPNRRATSAIPSLLEVLIRPWWLPILLFWVITFGVGYLGWLFK